MSEDYQGIEKEDSSQSKKSHSVTFRLDSKVIDDLQTEATNREISLNVLVNQILKRYAEWDRYENKIGMMPVPKVILSDLIDKALDLAKKNKIKDIDHYRDENHKAGSRVSLYIDEGFCTCL